MKTLIGAIIDKSGSMQTLKNDTIGGFNRFLEDQKKAPDTKDTSFIRTLFDTEVVTSAIVPLADAPELNTENYKPDGMTALLDAIHRTVRELEKTPADRYIILVITDGHENSSKEVNVHQVKALIEEKTKTDKWTFTYMGANVDAWAEASKIGIPAGNVAMYAASAQGTQNAYRSFSDATLRVRNNVNATNTINFFNAEEQHNS